MTTDNRFIVRSEGAELSVRSYAPATDVAPGCGVVLLHGLLSSADIFDVPGLEAMSLARRLRDAGHHVVTYDQRGAGASTTASWRFGLREHALVDLPAVLAACRARLGFDRVVLAGHSLGGTIFLQWLQRADAVAAPEMPVVVGAVALACPGAFDRRAPPWSDIVRRGRAFIDDLDRNRDGIVDRTEFSAGQVVLYWPWARLAFSPAAVAATIASAGRSRIAAGLVRRLPIPTLIYSRDDFDDATFQWVLRSRTLHRASHALFVEVYERITSGPAPGGPPLSLPLLAIGSSADRLVPIDDLRQFARAFDDARVLSTEEAFGLPSGHAGYFFKAGLRDEICREVLAFLRAVVR